MFTIILFIVYLALLIFCVNRLKFAAGAGLSRPELNALFLIKVMAGMALGWISQTWYPQGNDYFTLNNYGSEEYELLKSDPRTFFTSLFSSHYNHYEGFFSSTGSYWNDLKNNLIIKTLALMHVFTGGNYFVNVLFFLFASFLGSVALFRLFIRYFPQRRAFVIFGAFLIPSTLYFSSGIHKDAVVFTALALFCYALVIQTEMRSGRRMWIIVLSALVLLLVRSHVFAAILPASLALLLQKRFGVKRAFIFVYAITLAGVFAASFIPSLNPVKIITQKQSDFFALPESKSHLTTDTLTPTFSGLVQNTPNAIKNGLTEPQPWKAYNIPLRVLGIECWLYLLLVMFAVVMHNRTPHSHLLWFCIAIALPLFLFAGYIVPSAGAIVRYRALYYPWIILPVLMVIRFPKRSY